VGKGHTNVRRRSKQAASRRRYSRFWHHTRRDDREEKGVNVEGITWHAIVLEPEPFAATKALMTETFGLTPEVEAEGMVLFIMPNGTMLELNTPQAASADYGINDGLVFGFRVDDVEAASAAVEEAGCELLGEITRVEEVAYAYRRFRGPDGRVYSLNEQK
jgi:predicted enzyme related to lactoylglutathione lyase